MRFHLGIQLTRTGGLLAIAALLLLAAIAMPWYVMTSASGGTTGTMTYYLPTSTKAGGTVLTGCSSGVCAASQLSYAGSQENNTGNLATAVFYVLLVGLVCAVAGALLGLFTVLGPSWRRLSSILGLVALVTAIVAPLMWFAALPTMFGKDFSGHSGSGPWSSFVGSTTTAGGVKVTWAPSFGWYFSLAAFGVLLLALIWMLRKGRNNP